MLTKNLQELIATGSIDKDEPLFQLIHQIQEENSRYLIELNQQAYTHNEVRNLLATIIQDKIDETVTILLPFIQILDAIYILVKIFLLIGQLCLLI